MLSETGVTAATHEYDGLGHLIESEVETEPQLFVDQYFTRDPHGNAIVEQDFEDPFEFGELDPPGTKWDHDHHGSKGGRRAESEEVWDYKGLAEPDGWNPGHVVYTYDSAGNATDVYDSRYTHTYSGIETGWDDAEIDVHYRSYSKSYYDAEGRLRVHQINRDSLHYEELQVDSGPPWGAYEEYWYDALGRRVLKRSIQEDPICKGWDVSEERCYSSIARFVWDGDQILWELRQANDGDTKDPTGTALGGQTGHIGYVYAGGIDMPRGMIRNGTTIVLHRNWKGLTTFATDADGEPTTCAPDTYVSESCTPIVSFPGAAWALTQGYEGALDVQVWYGSVTMGHQDRSGLRYQRNRYHDPSAGQFTQLDPIGIAGGLNLYGYAGGDPVNFSDPLGLCPEELRDDDGECPGGWSVSEWRLMEDALDDHVTSQTVRQELQTMLEAGDIGRGVGLLGFLRGAGATGSPLTGNIRLRPDMVSDQQPGDLAFMLVHEFRHTRQRLFMGVDSSERDADQFGCQNTVGRVVFDQGGYPHLGGCR